MNKQFFTHIVMTSLTIFAMLFGAGNLMFPLRLGIEGGDQALWSFLGFSVTGVLLPLLGILAIVSFKGDYRAFFGRVGRVPGFLLILFCMMVIGPFVVMPRIVTLSYEMLQPFLPTMNPGVFGLFFLALVFIATFRPGKLLDIIGKVLSPLKVFSLLLIVFIGLITTGSSTHITTSSWLLFNQGLEYGYFTLDLIGAIFFGSIIVNLLTTYAAQAEKLSTRYAMKIAGISGIFAALLLLVVYAGMSYLGAVHGFGLAHLNEGQIFSAVSFRILGTYGAALIGLTVFLACFTTTVSLGAVVAEFVQHELFDGLITYQTALAGVLVVCGLIARHGLSAILAFSVPVIVAAYPLFIVITLCNLLYSLFNFQMIKIPVALIAVGTLIRLFL